MFLSVEEAVGEVEFACHNLLSQRPLHTVGDFPCVLFKNIIGEQRLRIVTQLCIVSLYIGIMLTLLLSYVIEKAHVQTPYRQNILLLTILAEMLQGNVSTCEKTPI